MSEVLSLDKRLGTTSWINTDVHTVATHSRSASVVGFRKANPKRRPRYPARASLLLAVAPFLFGPPLALTCPQSTHSPRRYTTLRHVLTLPCLPDPWPGSTVRPFPFQNPSPLPPSDLPPTTHHLSHPSILLCTSSRRPEPGRESRRDQGKLWAGRGERGSCGGHGGGVAL